MSESAKRSKGDRPCSVLFITYNGLLDPLGASQILPYIRMIREQGKQVHVLSFEKRGPAGRLDELLGILGSEGIHWTPLSYTRALGKLGKAWDLAKMYGAACWLAWRRRVDVIHCRSLHAAQVGLVARHIVGARVIFDMRGLWVDERVDGGIWRLSRPTDALLYRIYKRIERWALDRADAIVVLTDSVVEVVNSLVPGAVNKTTVIPCCADFGHFTVFPPATKREVRASLGIPANALVLCYLGSLGTWYRLADMARIYGQVLAGRPDTWFLMITRDWNDAHAEEFERQAGSRDACSQLVVRSATREQVPGLLGASDVMLSFIEPSFSKLASSPTKLAEAFAAGVPVISNRGVGDVASITADFSAGDLVNLGEEASFAAAVARLDKTVELAGLELRKRTQPAFDVERARKSYAEVYDSLGIP